MLLTGLVNMYCKSQHRNCGSKTYEKTGINMSSSGTDWINLF